MAAPAPAAGGGVDALEFALEPEHAESRAVRPKLAKRGIEESTEVPMVRAARIPAPRKPVKRDGACP